MGSADLPAVPKGVHRVVRRNPDGSVKGVYYYWRATGDKLPGDPSSPEFGEAIKRLMTPALKAGTVGALIAEYRDSPEFRRLKPNSKRAYERALEKLRIWDKFPIKALERGHAKRLQKELSDTPGIANQTIDVLIVLLQYAVEMGYVPYNVASRMKRLPKGEYSRWPDAAVAYAIVNLAEPYRRALVLALHTGQRAGDCLSMRWSDYDGRSIRVAQEKTGAKLLIPCHSELKRELDAWKEEAASKATAGVTILTRGNGRAWVADSFYTQFSRAVHAKHKSGPLKGERKHPLLTNLVFHGLRKTAAAKLAEAGCTTHEIAAITGHRTLEMIQHYTAQAEQETRAVAAILKLERKNGV